MPYSNPNTADSRRANHHPSYQRMPRREYEQRAHELANRGEKIATKLTEEKVRAIRANAAGMTDRQQGALYGVSEGMIYKIRKYERWGTVQ